MAMSGTRWVTAGLADQVVSALSNAAMILLAMGLLGGTPAGDLTAGAFTLCVGLGYTVLSLGREFVGSVLLAQASRLDGERRAKLVQHGLAAAFTLGCVAAVVLLLVWGFWRHPGAKIDLSYLVWLAPFMPLVLLQDAGRYAYLAEREPARALVIDLVWVAVQAVLVILMVVTGHATPGLLMASWGVGASAGAITFLLRTRARPWRGNPRRWIVETKHLVGWFSATAVIGQIHTQAINFLVAGRLSSADVTVLRTGTTAFLQPVQNFQTAMMGLLVPRSSRLAGDGNRRGLHRQTVRVAAAFVGLAVLLVAVVVPLAHLILPHLSKYAAIMPLALPISVQSGIYLLQIPFAAAVRGMHRARLLFAQYVIFAAASLTGLLIGANGGHLLHAVWGLVVGSATGLVVMIVMYAVAVRGVGVDAAPADGAEPSPEPVAADLS